MMAGLFAIYSLALALIIAGNRIYGIYLIVISLILSILMLWHHATDILKINW